MPTAQFAAKVVVSALLTAAASEAAKRSSLIGAAMAALPLTSLLAFVWLWLETHDAEKVGALSTDILWLVLPSLLLFVLLPLMLRAGWSFWLSLAVASAMTSLAYGATIVLLRWARTSS
jgi:hypothetical protein